MSDFLDTLSFTAAILLLVAATYFMIVGAAAIAMNARYLRCPLCHHHYLGTVTSPAHECPHGWFERGRTYLAVRLRHAQAGGGPNVQHATREIDR